MIGEPTPFGEWIPDASDLVANALRVARNVHPGVDSYLPALGLLAVSLSALPLPAKNLWFVQKTDGTYATYAATATKLYRYNADTLAFDDVSRLVGGDYGLPSDDRWSGIPFGNRLIVCQLGDVPQFIDVDVGTNFAALPGSPPIAKFVTVMDNKVVLSNLVSNPNTAQWSDVNDSEEWTNGLAGNQEFVDSGSVMGWAPHARIVLMERGMHGIVSTNDIYSFNFTDLSTEKGTTAPYAAIERGRRLYFLSVDDFYVVNDGMEEPIGLGVNRIIKDFFNTINNERLFQVQGTFDPFTGRLLWAFPTGDTEYNDRIQVFDPSLPSEIGPFGRWTQLAVDTYALARLATEAVSLEGGSDSTDMDEAGLPSLDSRLYMAGAPVLVAIGTDLKLSNFSGDTLEATLETGTYNFRNGMRSKVKGVLPMIFGDEADQITVNVSKKKRSKDAWVSSGATPQQASGWHRFNADGTFHKAEFVIPAAATWTHVQSWLADIVATSGR